MSQTHPGVPVLKTGRNTGGACVAVTLRALPEPRAVATTRGEPGCAVS